MFIGDYEQPTPWNSNGTSGCKRFLDRVYKLLEKVTDGDDYSKPLVAIMHRSIRDVSADIEAGKYNTAISKLMILSNEMGKLDKLTKKDLETMICLLNPFAPHMCEEMNEMLGNKTPLVTTPWPTYKEELTVDTEIQIAVQVNGKLRGTFMTAKDTAKEEMEAKALALPSVQNHTEGKTIRKIIVVPNKIVNIVAI